MSESTQRRSRVSRRWTTRIVLIGAVLIGFGIWGLVDATIVYPGRGERMAEFLEFQYLDQFAAKRGSLDARASIADVKGERARLVTQAANTPLDSVDQALAAWLDALLLVGRDDAASTTVIPRDDFRGIKVLDARSRRDELAAKWTRSGQKPPSPLSKLDIPAQWAIFAGGVLIGAYMLSLLLAARRKEYTFDPEARRLGLPGGQSLAPSDLEDIDKRKWHKFYVALIPKPGHPLAGKPVEIDLLRYEPVEEWVLEMEKAAFPDRVSEEESKRSGEAPGDAAPAAPEASGEPKA